MPKWTIFLIVAIVVAIILLNLPSSKKKDVRRAYLEALAKLLGAKVTPLAGYDNSYEVQFVYKEKKFNFIDIEDLGFQTKTYRAVLKAETGDNLTLSFTESSRTKIRADVNSISEVSSPWMKTADQVSLPKSLQGFHVFTNSSKKANALLADDQVWKVFTHFKNIDSRGHPVMSLEILEGVVTLKFHPEGNIKPSLFDIRHNVSSIQEYLDVLCLLIDRILQIKKDGEVA